MKIKLEDIETKAPNKILGAAGSIHGTFSRWSAITDGDSTMMIAMKVLIKFAGVAVMIVLSPFLLIGLTIAFLAVL